MDTPGTKPPVRKPGKGLLAAIEKKPLLSIGVAVGVCLLVALYFYRREQAQASLAAQYAAAADAANSQPTSPGYFTGGDSGELSDGIFPGSGQGGGGGGTSGGGTNTPDPVAPGNLDPGSGNTNDPAPSTGGGLPDNPTPSHQVHTFSPAPGSAGAAILNNTPLTQPQVQQLQIQTQHADKEAQKIKPKTKFKETSGPQKLVKKHK